jgi:hypothetical protein
MRSLAFALVVFSSLPALAADGSFTFLPPLVASAPQVVGNLDAAAHPTVLVFSTAKGSDYFADLSKEVRVEGNHFAVSWKVPALAGADIRVQVSYDPIGELGSVDLPGSSLTANQTVPIKFFFNGCIEQNCPVANQCHVAATCDPYTFQCSTVPLLCQPIDACHTAACDESLGVCTHPGVAGEYPTGPYAAAIGSTMPNLSYDGVLYSARTTETTSWRRWSSSASARSGAPRARSRRRSSGTCRCSPATIRAASPGSSWWRRAKSPAWRRR